MTRLFGQHNPLEPGDLVLSQSEPAKEGGRFWVVRVVIADRVYFEGNPHPLFIHEELQYADGSRQKAIQRANAFRRESGYVHPVTVADLAKFT